MESINYIFQTTYEMTIPKDKLESILESEGFTEVEALDILCLSMNQVVENHSTEDELVSVDTVWAKVTDESLDKEQVVKDQVVKEQENDN